MTKAIRISCVLSLAMLAGIGCKKSESTGAAGSAAPAAGSAAAGSAAAGDEDGDHAGWGRRGGGSAMSEADREKARHDRAEAMVKTFDKNGDGVVTVDELKGSPGRFAPDAEVIDADHDGKITADELATYMKEHRGRGHHRRNGGAEGSGGSGGAEGSGNAGSDSP